MARGGAGQQRSNGLNRLAVASDDSAHVGLAQLHPEHRRLPGRNLREHHFIGKLDQLANDELEELLHGPSVFEVCGLSRRWIERSIALGYYFRA